MIPIRKVLMPGVELLYCRSDKFKTGVLSCNFILPMTKESICSSALLACVLRRGTEKYPDIAAISEALDLNYGARLEAVTRKKGEYHCVGLLASFIDDRFTPQGEKLLEPMADMMGEMLLHPTLQNGVFREDYVAQEKENLLDDIRARKNDKREWADYCLLKALCAGEPYGVFREEEHLRGVTPESLYVHYREIFSSAPVKIVYCGSAEQSRVEAALMHALRELPREKQLILPKVRRHILRCEVQQICESMDVTQAKLAMGFGTTSDDFSALMLANALFGGTSNAKLFLHVREELSLCYYVSTQLHRSKGVITLSSGIAAKDYDRACSEIMRQLRNLQEGRFEPWEIPGARSILRGVYRAAADAPGRIESFTLGEAVMGTYQSFEDYLRGIEETDKDRIIAAAKTIALDTVYFLTGKEAAQ